jgi:uncharacterized membrane protein
MPEAKPKTIGRRFTLPRVFVAMSLAFGLAMTIISPPFQVPDEHHHFMRAYQITEGHLMSAFRDDKGGEEMPQSIQIVYEQFNMQRRERRPISFGEILRAARIPLAPDRRMYVEFTNTSAYSPFPYLPQVAAIAIGRPLGLTVVELIYLARLANLLLWTAAGYLALSLAPGIGRPLFLLMLMPMSIYLAGSMSADIVCSSLAILFSVMVWRQIAEPEGDKQISVGRAWLFALMACGIGLTKFVYVPLTALPLLIPSAAFGGWRRKRGVTAGVIAAGVAASVLWSLHTPGLDMVANGVGRDLYPRLQLEFLHQHPSSWLTVPMQTVKNRWRELIISFVGNFGWLDTPMAPIACVGYCLALFWACRPTVRDAILGPIWKWIIIISAILACCLFTLGLTAYLYWNSLGAPEVVGLQGRYLIPLTPAVVMLISCLWRRLPARFRTRRAEWKLEIECALIAAGAIVYGIYVIYMRFYTVKPWL